MKISDIWKEYLHEKKNLSKASDESYDLYLDKYAKDDKAKFPRKEVIAEKFFIPGKIYSFLYVTSDKPNPSRPVINRRPVILSLGQMVSPTNNKIYEIGIDFMLMPPKVRIFLFDRLQKLYSDVIEENKKNLNEGKKGKKALKLNYDVAKKLFDNLGWQMAFSVFEKGNVARSAVYDYEDWVSIIPLYTRGMMGKQLKEIYSEYIKRMTNPPEVKLNEKMKTSADRKREEIKKQQQDFRESQEGSSK